MQLSPRGASAVGMTLPRISPESFKPGSFINSHSALPTLWSQNFTTLQSVQPHFERKRKPNPKNDALSTLPPKPSILYAPFVQAMAFWYTHPQWGRKHFPKLNHMMDPKMMPLFAPVQPVKFNSLDNTKLQGYWLPTDKASKRTVILGHGYTADHTALLATAQILRKAGYNSFLFDYRAHGKSGGKQTSMGFHEGKDLAAALKTVVSDFKDQSEQVYYLGHSMGTAAVMYSPQSLKEHPDALKLMNERLDGIILDAPYYNFRESAEQFIKNMETVEKDNWVFRLVLAPLMKWGVGEKLVNGFHHITPKYLNIPGDLFAMVPAKILADSSLGQKPIQVLHGTADTTTPFHHGTRVFDALKARNPGGAEFVKMEGVEHMNREWIPDPAQGRVFWSANRANVTVPMLAFLDRISQNIAQKKALNAEKSLEPVQ